MKNVRQSGLGLIELMISLLLGLVVLAVSSQLYIKSQKTLQLNYQLGIMQESARVAMDYLAQHIRSAGYSGCPGSTNFAFAANKKSHLPDMYRWGVTATPIKGTQYSDAFIQSIPATMNAVTYSDPLVVLSLDDDPLANILSFSAGSLDLDQNLQSFFQDPSVDPTTNGVGVALVASDCSQVTLVHFRSSQRWSGNTISYGSGFATGDTTWFFTDSDLLGGEFDVVTGDGTPYAYDFTGGVIKAMKRQVFFVGLESDRLPYLGSVDFSRFYATSSSNPKGNYEVNSIVSGVEAMAVYYGVDTDDDGVPNRYITAADRSFTHSDWEEVVSVRVHLLTRSEVELTPSPRKYLFNGALRTPTDNYLRKEYVRTFSLRNLI